MWALIYLLVVHAFAQDANAGTLNANLGEQGSNPIDQELAQMSKELGEQPVKEQPAAQPEEQTADSPNTDVLRYVNLEPNEEIALVQYNVPAQIISTRPGDKVAIVPVGGKHTTPCPKTTSKSPHPHMFCQSCGKTNPKERGLINSYIDVSNSRECASLCARYLSKGNRCDVWEYHGEWRNKQCFLLYIPNFKKCSGDIGLLGELSFESGTCVQGIDSAGTDESLESEDFDLDSELSGDLPSWFPRVESSVGSIMENNPTVLKLSLGVLIILSAGAVYYRRTKQTTAGYMELLDNREEV